MTCNKPQYGLVVKTSLSYKSNGNRDVPSVTRLSTTTMPDIFDPVAAVYKQIGDDRPFFTLVDEFYLGVEKDLILRPLYPEDLTESKLHLALFLIQRTGGRTTYSDERGHPRMRARHLPFPIGTNEKNAWMKNMNRALLAVPEFEPCLDTLTEFFETFATFLINKPD